MSLSDGHFSANVDLLFGRPRLQVAVTDLR